MLCCRCRRRQRWIAIYAVVHCTEISYMHYKHQTRIQLLIEWLQYAWFIWCIARFCTESWHQTEKMPLCWLHCVGCLPLYAFIATLYSTIHKLYQHLVNSKRQYELERLVILHAILSNRLMYVSCVFCILIEAGNNQHTALAYRWHE